MIVTIDFETYFDKDYNLSKIPTAAYVRDPRFKVLGAGIKIDDGQSFFLKDGSELDDFIRMDIVNNKNTEILCHHTAFDGLILSHWYGAIPKFYYDTLSMSRPLLGHTTNLDLNSLAEHLLSRKKRVDILDLQGVSDPSSEDLEKISIRATDDVDLTYDVYQELVKDFSEEELEIVDTTIRMFTEPRIVIDREKTQAILDEEANSKEQLLEKLGLTAKDVRSPKTFAMLLERAGAKVPYKPSPTNPEKQTYAFARTDSALEALRNSEIEEVRDLVNARLTIKANQIEKRAERLLECTEYSAGRLSIPLKYCGAHTFRWSGFDYINPQNFGRQSPLRRCLLAREGYYLDVKDYAQIEARVVAWLAEQEDLVAAFADPNRDPYSEFATELFGFEVTKKTYPRHRFIAKTIILGCGYGMGWERLKDSIKNQSIVELGEEMIVTPNEAMKYINAYRRRYDKIADRRKGLWGKMTRALEHMCIGNGTYEIGPMIFERGKVLMPNNLYLIYNGISGYGNPDFGPMRDFSYISKDFNNTRIGIYDGKATENFTSCLSRIITTQGMNRVKIRYPSLLQVHDEVVFEIPQNNAQDASNWITEQLTLEPEWAQGLPLEVEGGYDREYSK